MHKNLLIIAVSSIFFLSSCIKCYKDKDRSFSNEVSTEEVQINLPTSGFEISELETTSSSSDDYYTSGVLEYKINGVVQASVDFGDGELNSKAIKSQNGIFSELELKKDYCTYKGEKSEYKKVIVRPLVKTDDCDFIVAGIIKYYSVKDGTWAATIDFGNGNCDDLAIKTTAEGESTFQVSKYYN